MLFCVWGLIFPGFKLESFLPLVSALQRVKSLPAMQEIWVWSLGREDPLEKEMATHSSILAWKIPRMEEPGRLQSMGSQRVRHDWATSFSLFKIGPVTCESFAYGEIVLSFCLLVCFSSAWRGWVRWSSCLLMTGFVFLFCLLFRWGRVLLLVGWCWVFYSGGFFCVGSHYLILLRVISLIV